MIQLYVSYVLQEAGLLVAMGLAAFTEFQLFGKIPSVIPQPNYVIDASVIATGVASALLLDSVLYRLKKVSIVFKTPLADLVVQGADSLIVLDGAYVRNTLSALNRFSRFRRTHGSWLATTHATLLAFVISLAVLYLSYVLSVVLH